MKKYLLFTLPLLLTGCVERTTHLYPTNDIAKETGVLEGDFMGHGNLHGVGEVTLPDGEVLKGEYSIVPDDSEGYMVSAPGHGEASMYGTKGTSAHCTFENNNFMGHGFGDCELSTGETYHLVY